MAHLMDYNNNNWGIKWTLLIQMIKKTRKDG